MCDSTVTQDMIDENGLLKDVEALGPPGARGNLFHRRGGGIALECLRRGSYWVPL